MNGRSAGIQFLLVSELTHVPSSARILAVTDLDSIFHPRSIAIVGASPEPFSPTHIYFFYPLIRFGYQGRIYPVNPRGGEVMGLKAYPALRDIPETVDHAICAVPASLVSQVVRDCAAAGIKSVTVFTAGFSETGDAEGIRLEQELLETARQGGIRIIGPNCLGIHCPEAGVSLDDTVPKVSGPVGFLSQSGGNARDLVVATADRRVFVSKGVSLGNALDLNESDFLEYLADDSATEVIAAYVEGIKQPQRFRRALQRACNRKPVIILKGGKTGSGAGAVSSHTGALAGSRVIWDTLCRQTGAVQANHFDEWIDVLMTFVHLKPPQGRRIGLVGMGGGASVLAADECEEAGLIIPSFPDKVRQELLQFIPRTGVGLRNPVDSATNVYFDPATLARTVKVVADWDGVDLLFVVLPTILGVKMGPQILVAHVESLASAADAIGKPVAIILRSAAQTGGEKVAREVRYECLKAGFPAFDSVDQAARAVNTLISYRLQRGAV